MENPNKSGGRLEYIPLSRIKPSDRNPRGPNVRENDSHRENLRESIADFGILVPLVVRRTDGNFELVDGERRYWIAKSLKVGEVPAFIIGEQMDAKALLQRMFQIHMNRDQWDAVQQCKASEELFAELRAKYGQHWHDLTAEFARFTGDDVRTARNRVQFLRWPEKIKNDVYSDPEKHSSYWYIVEIEDKIIEPALANYPEYFDNVSVDEVREFLYRKWEANVVKAAIDVRPAATIARSKIKEKTKRRKVLKIIDRLVRHTELPYQEAYDEFARQFPSLVEPKLPRPRTLLSSMRNLTYTLGQYEPEFFQVYGKSKGTTFREALEASHELIEAASRFSDKLSQASGKG
jgi:ParB family transcriptional regulator, chromosome partitioning protein